MERRYIVRVKNSGHCMNASRDLAKGLCDTLCALDEQAVQNDLVVDDGEDLANLLVVPIAHLDRKPSTKRLWRREKGRNPEHVSNSPNSAYRRKWRSTLGG